jgi:hypothetical protein
MLALQRRTEDRSSAPDDDLKVKVGVLFFQFSIMINIAIRRRSVHGAPKEVHRWVNSCARQHSGTAATGADFDGSVTRGCIAFVQRAQKRQSLEPQSHNFFGQNLRCPGDMSGGQCLTQRDTCNSQRSQTQKATHLQQQHEDPPRKKGHGRKDARPPRGLPYLQWLLISTNSIKDAVNQNLKFRGLDVVQCMFCGQYIGGQNDLSRL